ncbi:MAG: amidase, partial [Acidimicrobiia bacterium]|nr:amidase [Acidimicrobiia bacterium]
MVTDAEGDLGRRRTEAAAGIEATLQAIADSQPSLNAFTEIDPSAVDAARRLTADQMSGTLAGVPVALKDIVDHAGHTTTCGSSFYRDTPDRSATVVQRLETAGAVVVGRTGLHEFAFGFSSENPWFGAVRNPWNPETSPGGSSGGSAAAVAAGLVPIAIGTDTGGSVRVPAALCGVVGLKVTHGRIPLTGVFPLVESLDTVGPITRTVIDARAAYRVMAGHDPADPWSVPEGEAAARPVSQVSGLRIGIPQPWVDAAPMTTEALTAFQQTLGRLTDLGAIVDEVHHPLLAPPGHLAATIGGEVAPLHRAWFSDPANQYGDDVAERIEAALSVTLDEFVDGLRWRSALRQAVDTLWERVDVMVTPGVGVSHKVIGADQIDIDGSSVHYRTVVSWFASLVNQMGLPALVLPLLLPGSPPPSLQLIGPRWSEERLLEIGRR